MDDMLKDVFKLDLTPEGGLPVFSNMQRGMSILNRNTGRSIRAVKRIFYQNSTWNPFNSV